MALYKKKISKNRSNIKKAPPKKSKRVAKWPFLTDKETETFFEFLFNSDLKGVLVTDNNGLILNVNKTFTKITGYSALEAIGKRPSMLQSQRHDKPFYQKLWKSILTEGVWQGEVWNRRKNGEIYPQMLQIFSTNKLFRKKLFFVAYISDLTHNIVGNENSYHAYYDKLTGLPNRILLQDRLNFMINHVRRNNQNMAVLLLDVNRFKFINDTLGYAVGDLLLQTMAARLKSCLREHDAVFRQGDDEFALILDEIYQTQDAAKVAKRVLAVCSLPFQLMKHELYVTVSIGISIFPNDGENLELLLKNAEVAMNRAKELGINNYQHYTPAMNAKAFEQLTFEHDLRKALKHDELLVYYQPLVDMSTNKIVGSEALIRWKHPTMGLVPPLQFIPLAEETGLILPIGEWVLQTACHQSKKWIDLTGQELTISVNLSARQFQQPDLIVKIDRILNETKLPPKLLELEITESLGMKNPELTFKILKEMKDREIRISVDDFGTGYSSLSHLKKFPIDKIKIDRSFVKDLQADLDDNAIILAIIALAHSLQLSVVAEGVEKKEQAEFLVNNGCKLAQGFLYSPPIPADEFTKRLLDQK